MTIPDAAWHEKMYDNRRLVPNYGEHLAKWQTDSARARQSLACQLDVACGNGVGDTLDIFPSARGGWNGKTAVLVFIHGGYWRGLDKSDYSFVATAFPEACVVLPNYALCPGTAGQAVTVPAIAQQLTRTLAWVWREIAAYGGDRTQIFVMGHSAGGHLAAMLLGCLWQKIDGDLPPDLVKGALSISGLFDLAPLQKTPFLQADLHLTDQDVRQASPATWPAPRHGVLFSVVGGDESPEYLRHNESIRAAWGEQVVPVCKVLPGLNHFSIMGQLNQVGSELHNLARQLALGEK